MTPTIKGTLQPVRKELRIDYDPQRGRTVTEQWESAGAGLNGIAQDCESRGIAYSHVISSAKSKLISSTSGAQAGVPDIPVDTWQLLGNDLQNDVKTHPTFLALGRTEVGLIAADAEAVLKNETIDDAYYITNDTSGALLNLLVNGQTHYVLGQYVLRHTANVSNEFEGLTSADGELYIYTTSQLLSEIGSGWAFNCPARLRTKIGNIGVSGTFHSGHMWGWLKKTSTETTSANNRSDISFEYWFGEWNTYLYPVL
jgi:hypothetical protein